MLKARLVGDLAREGTSEGEVDGGFEVKCY
jgi:hypothetical protein